MIQLDKSWWGVKNSGEDISQQIIDIVNNASAFVIVTGYNFTFKTSAGARPFFQTLINKIQSGVPILMIFPPSLHGKYNPQPAIIKYCLDNGIAIILNHQNHSKWLLTDSQMYYGSSNFTNASWKDRVEVISLHDHIDIRSNWAKKTANDFGSFIIEEISKINDPQRRMASYRGLLTATRNTWISIKPLIKKLNPSIIKVIETLTQLDYITILLNREVSIWFEHYEETSFEFIFRLSNKIANSIDEVCSYAYGNIYNESTKEESRNLDLKTINEYNGLCMSAIETIDNAIKELPNFPKDQDVQLSQDSDNLLRINKVYSQVQQHLLSNE